MVDFSCALYNRQHFVDHRWGNRVAFILLLLILKQWDIISVIPCLTTVTLIKQRYALRVILMYVGCHGDIAVGNWYPEATRR